MNDEKTAVINMVSEGTLTSSEGIALFEALSDLEGMGGIERDVEVDDPGHLPPWESSEGQLTELFEQNKCVRVISSANEQIISALREGNLGETPSKISALDLVRLSRGKPSGKDGNGGFTMGSFRLQCDDIGVHTRGWGFWMGWWMHTELELPPTWGESMLRQIFGVSGKLLLNRESDEWTDEEGKQIKVSSRVESDDDSVTTKAGKFDDCLKVKIVITPFGDAGFEKAKKHDIHDKLKRIGTQYIWFAPNVGIVKFLHEHPNDTRTEIELVDYNVQGKEPLYFPLSLGSNWLYEWRDELTIHRELIRVILRETDGSTTISCANHAAEIQSALDEAIEID